MLFQNILLEIKDGLAFLTVNRPNVLNALNHDTYCEIIEALNYISKDDSVTAVILTGAGEKAFIAGADISEMCEISVMESRKMTLASQTAANLLEELPQPVIAAINGYAIGGGCELALACDIRIASTRAKFCQPEAGLGIIPGGGGTQRLSRIIGEGRAKYYCLTGDTIPAAEALRIGLVNAVTEPELLMDESIRIAKVIHKKAPIAVQMVKLSIHRGMDVDLKKAIANDAELQTLCFATEDRVEGMTAFLQKRPACFRGK